MLLTRAFISKDLYLKSFNIQTLLASEASSSKSFYLEKIPSSKNVYLDKVKNFLPLKASSSKSF